MKPHRLKHELIALTIAVLGVMVLAASSALAFLTPARAKSNSNWVAELGGDFTTFVTNLERDRANYLGTPYNDVGRMGGPKVGMDCSSFPAFAVYYETGQSSTVAANLKAAASQFNGTQNETLGAPNTQGWVSWARSRGLDVKEYGTLDDLLARADLVKGDLIVTSTNPSFEVGDGGAHSNNHCMIYWGDESDPNRAFHQTNIAHCDGWVEGDYCQISDMMGKTYVAYCAVIPGARNGLLSLEKASANPSVSDGNTMYSLAGATYGVFSDSGCQTQVATLTCDAKGHAEPVELRIGTYYVKELKAATGFALDSRVFTADVTADNASEPVVVRVSDVPQSDAADLVLQKLSAEIGEALPQGAATLAGAEFEVRYYDTLDTGSLSSRQPKATWVLRTDAEGRTGFKQAAADPNTYLVSGSPLYRNQDGTPCMPIGTYTLRETKAPEGYLPDNQLRTSQVRPEGTAPDLHTWNAPKVAEQVKRGDLRLTKAADGSAERLGSIPFLIISTTTGESHVLVTDENGQLSTASRESAHTASTNANDDALDETGAVDESKLDPHAGVWFYGRADRTTSVDDAKGALPYDTYEVRELPCRANANLRKVSIQVHISRDLYTCELGTVVDDVIEPPSIHTLALDGEDADKLLEPGPGALIRDTVAYAGLEAFGTYRVEGTLMDPLTGEPLTDEAGDPITATLDFTAPGVQGTVEVEFTVDGTDLMGRSVVVFERLYALDDDGEPEEPPVATHEDLEDDSQTVTFSPLIETRAFDPVDSDGTVLRSENTRILDRVSVEGLLPGATYRVVGTLANPENGEELVDEAEEPAQSSVTFVARDATAEVGVPFTVDTTSLVNDEVVVYERLYSLDVPTQTVDPEESGSGDGELIQPDEELAEQTGDARATLLSAHTNPNNKSQTVTVEAPTTPETVTASPRSSGQLPKTGYLPLIPLCLAVGGASAIALILLAHRKPRKLGGQKGDVW